MLTVCGITMSWSSVTPEIEMKVSKCRNYCKQWKEIMQARINARGENEPSISTTAFTHSAYSITILSSTLLGSNGDNGTSKEEDQSGNGNSDHDVRWKYYIGEEITVC